MRHLNLKAASVLSGHSLEVKWKCIENIKPLQFSILEWKKVFILTFNSSIQPNSE